MAYPKTNKLTLHNVRLGHATNSSSSHSFIIFDSDKRNPSDALNTDLKTVLQHNSTETGFGRDHFTASSIVERMEYLYHILYVSLRQLNTPEWVISLIVKELLGFEETEYGYLDHQSILTLPVDYHNRNSINLQFWEQLVKFFSQDGFAILGGNDEDGIKHHRADDGEEVTLPINHRHNPLIAKYDNQFEFWTLYNSESGAKIRFSFGGAGSLKNPKYASTPDLVDLKITDNCPYNCSFCYMASTKDGEHADAYYIMQILSALSDMEVFEIALGGGEPTLHPQFVDILEYGKQCGLKMNFTTKNITWLKNDKLRRRILENCGAFAVSINSADTINEVYALAKTYNINPNRINFHIVMGATSSYQLTRMFDASANTGMRLTLLGYKETGRGSEYKIDRLKDYSNWLDLYKKAIDYYGKHRIKLSVDTVMIQQFKDQFEEYGVPSWQYHTEDGTFSAYIDAVNKHMMTASYLDYNDENIANDITKFAMLPDSNYGIDSGVISTIYKNFNNYYA